MPTFWQIVIPNLAFSLLVTLVLVGVAIFFGKKKKKD